MQPARAEPAARGSSVAELLQAWNNGDRGAFSHLMPILFTDLYRTAERLLARERADPMLQPGALVNELYLRFEQRRRVDWRDPEHFLAISVTEMRRILVMHARRRQAAKRGFGRSQVALSEAAGLVDEGAGGVGVVNALALGTALARLKSVDAEAGRIVEQRFFFGLSMPEIARRLGTTERTVYRRWAFAKSWLYDQLTEA